MQFPPDNASKKLRREVAAHEALTEIADPFEVLSDTLQRQKIREELKQLHTMINEMETRRRDSKELLHKMIDDLETRILFAFPNADFVRHHAEHLGAKEDREFWKRMRTSTGLAAFWVGVVAILLLIFTGRR